jgi:integrase
MSVKVRKKGGAWYVFVNYHSRRKAKKVGSQEAAEQVKRAIEVRLALGDLGCLEDAKKDQPGVTLADFGRSWIRRHGRENNKPSTEASYLEDFERYVVPRFGTCVVRPGFIRRRDLETWIGEMEATRLQPNTRRLAVGALRRVLDGAVLDGLLEANPATGLGRLPKWFRREQKGSALNFAEVNRFLEQALSEEDRWYELFLAALHSGLRLGELQGLRWHDLQLGRDENDVDLSIFVQRSWDARRTRTFLLPKGNRKRRVDLTPELRDALVKLRDRRMLDAYSKGKLDIAEDLVFGNQNGSPFESGNLVKRHFEPLLERAGLRRIRFHDLRHTYGSLLLEANAPLKYVSEQMGHSSIQVTAEVYCHKLASGNTAHVARLSEALRKEEAKAKTRVGLALQLSATQAQPRPKLESDGFEEVLPNEWLGGRDSNPDTQIQSLQSYR